MFESRVSSTVALSQLEMSILELIKPKSQTESRMAKALKVDPNVLSPVVTDLILKGYVELFRRRWIYFFSKESCTITLEGISALESARSPYRGLVEMIQTRASNAIERLADGRPALKIAFISATALYRLARAMV